MRLVACRNEGARVGEDTRLIEVQLSTDSDGVPLDRPVVLYVEARSDESAYEGEVSSHVVDSLTGALEAVRVVSAQIAQSVKDIGPDSFEIQLGFELKSEAGGLVAMLVRAGATATMQVTLQWQGEKPGGTLPALHLSSGSERARE